MVFNIGNQKVVNFLMKFQKKAKDAFEKVALANDEQFLFFKIPPLLKKSKNTVCLGEVLCQQNVTYLGKEIQLDGYIAKSDNTQLTCS